jgi:hypothetical protein
MLLTLKSFSTLYIQNVIHHFLNLVDSCGHFLYLTNELHFMQFVEGSQNSTTNESNNTINEWKHDIHVI